MEKKFYKSTTDKIISGVCGGIGEAFNLNPWIIRIVFILFGCGFLGIVAYFALAYMLPEGSNAGGNNTATPKSNTSTPESWGDEWETEKPTAEKNDDDDKSNNTFTLG